MLEDKSVGKLIREMREQSTWFWTGEINSEDADSDLKNLLDTQDAFREILETSSPKEVICNMLNSQEMTPKLATQHLMRASDCSAEFLDRVTSYIQKEKLNVLNVNMPNKKSFTYDIKKMNSKTKKMSTKNILSSENDLLYDIMTIILFGSVIDEFRGFISFQKLDMSNIIGDKSKLNSFLMRRYLVVSRQTQGTKSVNAGTATQQFVRNKIKTFFEGKNYFSFVDGSRIPKMEDDPHGHEVDLVCKIYNGRNDVFIAIEVAFQETTNSVIERKARQASLLYEKLQRHGHYLCFVIDGGGYFARPRALEEIVQNSHKVVTLKQLDSLCQFMDELS